jgi:CDP-diacylglycerol--glycerol-3-phosphate 3-phosphatidyltransferase
LSYRDAEGVDPATLDIWADPAKERFATPATIITFIRTAAAVTIMGFAMHADRSGGFWSPALKLLVIGLVVYWAGDSLDGQVARRMHHETRIGAVLDIMSDRFCSAAFYLGLAWLHPEFTVPVLIYLAEFMVIDCFLSITFLAWGIRSPNYFYVIDRAIYRLNWTHPAKAVNSALFAVFLLVTHLAWVGAIVASALLVFKIVSLVMVARIGLPVPPVNVPGGPTAGGVTPVRGSTA